MTGSWHKSVKNDFLDTQFRVSDDGDNTKKVALQLSGLTTGNTRTLTVPNFDGTIATLAGTETLTNKTLTAPVIADFTNAAHDHGDADDGGGALADGSVASTKLVEAFFRGRYQSNTSNSAPTGLTVQFGWGYITGDDTIKIEESVTFPTAFSVAPIVLISYSGLRTTASGAPDSPDDLDTTYSGTPVSIGTEDITTTGFAVNMVADTGATLLSTRNHGYTWLAIGTV